MGDLLDADLLRAYLTEALTTFRTMDGRMDPATDGNAKVTGAIRALEQVQREVIAGRFHPPKVDPASNRPAYTLARRTDSTTSLQAALEQTSEKRRALYAQIHAWLRLDPMTDDELLRAFTTLHIPHTPSGVRTRRRELVDAGWVTDSGRRRPSNAGRPSIVWQVTP